MAALAKKSRKGTKKAAKTQRTSSKKARVKKSRKSWSDVPHDKKFHLRDGRILSNVAELPEALQTVTIDVFEHHVNDKKNDFANWVAEVVKEEALAIKLKQAKTHKHTLSVLRKHI